MSSPKEEDAPRSRLSLCATCGVAIICGLGISALVIFLLYYLNRDDNDEPQILSKDNIFEEQTTEVETSPPSDRVAQLREILEPLSQETLLDPTSPQTSALTWLADEDPTMLDFDTTPLLTIYERYIAALLFYGLGGKGWWKSHNFLTALSVCDWNDGEDAENFEGIRCDPNESIEEIILDMNRLKGTLPKEIAALLNLRALSLGSNRGIVGTIPTEFGSLGRLEWLNLGGDNLLGELPVELANLSRLKALIVYGNQLEGDIPSSFSSLRNLDTLFLEGNALTPTRGVLDSIFCQGRPNTVGFKHFYADCTGDSECSCCTYCCDKGIACAIPLKLDPER